MPGTHPELIHLTALIEARRRHRLRMVEQLFEEEQRHFAKMAAAEEREAWMTWSVSKSGGCAYMQLRREQLRRENRH